MAAMNSGRFLPGHVRSPESIEKQRKTITGRPRRLLVDGKFTCKRCGEAKPPEEFYGPWQRGENKPPGWSSRCKVCLSEQYAEKYRSPGFAEARAKAVQRKRYGVTLEELIEAQGHPLCALCGRNFADCVDHDHDTGKVRGALCRICNMALHYHENEEWKARADAYLEGGDPAT